MSATPTCEVPCDQVELKQELLRLKKIISSLMDRAERSTVSQSSSFNDFQTTVMLEEQVRHRTAELELVLRENEKVNQALRASEARFRGLANQSLVGIAITERGKFTYTNPKFQEIFGYSGEELAVLEPVDVAADDDKALVAEQVRRRLSGEVSVVAYTFRGRKKCGAEPHIECHSSVMEMGGHLALVSVLLDITDRTLAASELLSLQQQLRAQATHDSLTGLFNRQPLQGFFERELSVAAGDNGPVSLVLADLDHFKSVNDLHGHLFGDEVLRVFGQRMKTTFRASDLHCRYGGEEFLSLLPGMATEDAKARTEELRKAIAENPIEYDNKVVRITASFGVSTFPQDGITAEGLIQRADARLYLAKRSGRNRVVSDDLQG
jgi:diguanylate cyclase (GGDEF)-like protein/PAS domain S-box-containing protein